MSQQPISKMSRESRKLYEFLGSLCSQRGVTQSIGVRDIYISDMLMIKYYSAPIINIIGIRAKTVKKWDTRHGGLEYWLPMISSMLGKSTSAVRPNAVTPDWLPVSEYQALASFGYITERYLIVDYGYDDMVMIQRIVNTYSTEEVMKACAIGKQNNVYEARYINAILEKETAKKQIELQKVEDLGNRIQSSDRLLNETIHEHSVLDMAQVEYNWNKVRENARLEQMWKERFGK